MSPPVYDRIRQELEATITSGQWPPGTRVPTETELARTHGVSRVTVQRAVRELVQRGLVVRYRRHGTFVAQALPERNLLHLVSPGAGPEIEGRHLVSDARVIPAQDAAVEMPGAEPDTPVVQLRRVKLDIAERPVATELAAIPFALVPRLLDEELADLTTIAYFRRAGVPIHRSRLYIEPELLSEGDARVLDRPAGSPVFRLTRHIRLADDRHAETLESVLLPGECPLYIEQSLAQPPSD